MSDETKPVADPVKVEPSIIKVEEKKPEPMPVKVEPAKVEVVFPKEKVLVDLGEPYQDDAEKTRRNGIDLLVKQHTHRIYRIGELAKEKKISFNDAADKLERDEQLSTQRAAKQDGNYYARKKLIGG